MAFCRACGHQVHDSAISCPQCGALQNTAPVKNQTVAVLLTAFLGGLGIHRFYLGKPISGVLYLLFCWTGIPSIIALVETLVYAFMAPHAWATKYNNGRVTEPVPKPLVVLITAIPVVIFMGIVAAIVVPAMINRPLEARSASEASTEAVASVLPAFIREPMRERRRNEARVLAARQDISTIMQALQLYRLDNRQFPTTEQGLQSLVARPTLAPVPRNWKDGGYIEKLPRDPWGNPYQYLSPGIHNQIDVFSLGADGQPGGSGPDADLGSWDQ